jgi:Tfp pilus assembly protein PilP
MKKNLTLIILLTSFSLFTHPVYSQQEKKKPEKELKSSPAQTTLPTYKSEGRRDPFRDLLGGRESQEKERIEGREGLSVDDIVLVGIASYKGEFEAIINDPEGFPYFIKKGDTFLDGFVLSINESQVIFRKTKEKGVPLRRPREIIKVL